MTSCVLLFTSPPSMPDEAPHERLLHVEAVLRLVDDEGARRADDRVGRLDVAPERQAVAEEPAVAVSAIFCSSTMKCLCFSRIGFSSSQRPKYGMAPQLFA